MIVVGVLFNPWDRKTYDYLTDLDLAVGDRVVVWTGRGESVVTVASIKNKSDKATAKVLRRADEGDTL